MTQALKVYKTHSSDYFFLFVHSLLTSQFSLNKGKFMGGSSMIYERRLVQCETPRLLVGPSAPRTSQTCKHSASSHAAQHQQRHF